jgi:D-sedoheptulose 7-phosphate isomerase
MAEDTSAIDGAAEVILASILAGGTVYVCGNGGSFSQAQHFAAELTGRYRRDRRPIAAVALGSNGAHVTAVANDYGYEYAFAREVAALVRPPHDVTVLLSTSGTSINVQAVAKVLEGTPLVAVLGQNLGTILHGEYPPETCIVAIPTDDVALCQEATLSVLHSITEAIDEAVE